jgi:hypothetical protein
MAVNYDDKRFTEVKDQEATAIRETEGKYNNMINQSDSFYQQQIDASKDWANKQSEIQQAQTDFAIEKVEQTKEQAKKDYTKEQKAAYTDYQKATNEYGANAETLASQGLQNTGYSESTRTSMYNTYQNRYMSARESYNQAILNYDNSIKEAQLANNAQLAQIAYEALQKQLELSLQGFQYKNTLVLQKLEAVNQQRDRYYERYQDVLQQINTENALAEQIRQYNESLAEQKRQHNETLALNKQKLAEEQRQYNENLAFQKSQAAQEQANWEKEYALARSSTGSSGSSGGSSKLTSGSSSSSKGSSSGSSKVTNSSSTNKSSSSNSSKTTQQAPQDVVIKYNGEAYYQSYDVALKAGGYGGYSLTGALQKGYLKTIKRNGAIYYAPVGKSSSSSSSSNWRNIPLSSVDRVFSFK